MKKLLLLMLVLLGGVITTYADNVTFYYAVSPADVNYGKYAVDLNMKYGSGEQEWNRITMTKTSKTFNGKYIYTGTIELKYGGYYVMEFLINGGQADKPYDNTSSWATDFHNGKIYEHSSGWKDYYTDGLKGSWDGWTDKIEFENGEATVDLTAGNYYDFQIEVGNVLYGPQNSGATMFWNNCTNWTLNNNSYGRNCILQASVSGTYTFTIAPDKVVSVTFPAYTPNEVYVYNNMSLAAGPYAYILKGDYWNNNGSGSKNQPKGVTMTQVGSSNVWKAEYPAGAKSDYIVFTEFLMDDYESFNGGKAVYRNDFPSTTSVFVPNTSTTDVKNGTTYYTGGAWHPFPTYTRTVTEGNFGTICLPFNATVVGATIFNISGVVMGSNNKVKYINLEEVEGNVMEAGKAYIFQATSSTLTATLSGNYSDAIAIADAGNGMKGNISSTKETVTPGYYIVKDNQIREAGDYVVCGQYKGYITLVGISPTSARGAYYMSFEDETTGIANVDIDDNFDANAPMYNLAGQRVGKNYKGVVVVNGKKVVLK